MPLRRPRLAAQLSKQSARPEPAAVMQLLQMLMLCPLMIVAGAAILSLCGYMYRTHMRYHLCFLAMLSEQRVSPVSHLHVLQLCQEGGLVLLRQICHCFYWKVHLGCH